MPVASVHVPRVIAQRSGSLAGAALIGLVAAALAGLASPAPVAAAVDPLGDPGSNQVGGLGATASHHVPKALFVVGATGWETSRYRSIAHRLAVQARDDGAYVLEIYSPNATWSRVRRAAEGADLLVYLGHGNGWPSPHPPFRSDSKDGLGLNLSASGSNDNTKYYGESFLVSSIRLAPNSVVLLVHLCYASGSSAEDSRPPSLQTAQERVDNYGAGFLRTGARAVVAEGLGHAGYLINGLFHSNATLQQLFVGAPQATGKYAVEFNAHRSPGWARGLLDPERPGRYYRSIIGDLGMSASTWR